MTRFVDLLSERVDRRCRASLETDFCQAAEDYPLLWNEILREESQLLRRAGRTGDERPIPRYGFDL